MSKPDGGPAFPRTSDEDAIDERYHGCPGMSLRQWYAGQALIAGGPPPQGMSAYDVAARAFYIADAMIAEDEK